jgi:hypothetical protein
MIVNKMPIRPRADAGASSGKDVGTGERRLPALQHTNGAEKAGRNSKGPSMTNLPQVRTASTRPNPRISRSSVANKTVAAVKALPEAPSLPAPGIETKETTRDRVLRLLSSPPDGTSTGTIKVKFNHYNKMFPVHNGVLKWIDVDSEYAFSFVYRGDFKRDISPCDVSLLGNAASNIGCPCTKDEDSEHFLDLTKDGQYIVTVVEDPVAGVGIEGFSSSKPYKAPSTNPNPAGGSHTRSGNNATKLLTNDLLALDPKSLGDREAKDLIERRDIEDILFAN